MTDRASFRSPFYAKLSSLVEERLGLPRGLLHSIVTKGERSNANQVSEAGARTVFQIIPETRSAIMRRYKVDAYASPENAALAAGHLLRESLDRNNGDVRAAVAEYHGGVDRRQWGPRTKAYVRRVIGGGIGGPSSGRTESTYARASRERREARAEQSGPSLSSVYQAYRSGRMAPAERAEFEADVRSGAIMLPRGARIESRPSAATVLPAGVIEAYNSGQMSASERGELERDLKAGLVSLPTGAKLAPPKPRTARENLAIGVRGVAEGAADLAGIVANPLNSLINMTGLPQAITGRPLGTDLGQSATAALTEAGLPQVRPEEELANRMVRGGDGRTRRCGLGPGRIRNRNRGHARGAALGQRCADNGPDLGSRKRRRWQDRRRHRRHSRPAGRVVRGWIRGRWSGERRWANWPSNGREHGRGGGPHRAALPEGGSR